MSDRTFFPFPGAYGVLDITTLYCFNWHYYCLSLSPYTWQHWYYRSSLSVDRPIKLASVDLVEGAHPYRSRMGHHDSERHCLWTGSFNGKWQQQNCHQVWVVMSISSDRLGVVLIDVLRIKGGNRFPICLTQQECWDNVIFQTPL